MIIELGHNFAKKWSKIKHKVLFYSGRSLQHRLNGNIQKLFHFGKLSILTTLLIGPGNLGQPPISKTFIPKLMERTDPPISDVK